MEKYVRAAFLLAAAALFFSGCYSVGGERIKPDSLRLPPGARVLICEATRDVFRYEIGPFRERLNLPGLEIADVPKGVFRGASLDRVVRDMLQERPVEMVLVVVPVTRLERQYNPYPVFRGWRKRTYREGTKDGRPVFQTREEPVYETRFKYECSRTTYRVYQFNGKGELTGTLHIPETPFEGCPETTEKDILYDEIDVLVSWLKNHVSVQ